MRPRNIRRSVTAVLLAATIAGGTTTSGLSDRRRHHHPLPLPTTRRVAGAAPAVVT